MTTEAKDTSTWETETGLPNDIDAWITNPRFGQRDEYVQKVQAAGGVGEVIMLLIDLADANGEVVGTQGYSIGTGWIPSDDGMEISHPKRKNVVGSSMYGQLQNRVRKELGVKMEDRGLPTQAKSWDKLGFHWLLEEHPTVGGEAKQGLMPVEILGERKAGSTVAAPAAPAAIPGIAQELELKLKELAQSNDVKAFQVAALKYTEVVANDPLMASILDDGPTGFHATHQ